MDAAWQLNRTTTGSAGRRMPWTYPGGSLIARRSSHVHVDASSALSKLQRGHMPARPTTELRSIPSPPQPRCCMRETCKTTLTTLGWHKLETQLRQQRYLYRTSTPHSRLGAIAVALAVRAAIEAEGSEPTTLSTAKSTAVQIRLEPPLLEPQEQLQQTAAADAPSAAYCRPEVLSGLLNQFGTRSEGFDNGLQMDGLLAYYRRLGCSSQQLDLAVRSLIPRSEGRETNTPTGYGLGAPSSTHGFEGVLEGVYSERLSVWAEVDGGRSWALSTDVMRQLKLASWELLAAVMAAAGLAAYQSRPRGWSRKDLLEVRESRISGRGVFARAPIPVGTVLGAYPGRLRSAAEMVAKCQETPLAASYIFRTGDGRFLDPTDASGYPSPYPQPGWPWPVPTDVVLAYVNEPPKSSPGTNAAVEDGPQPGDLLFVASIDIPPESELLIDYGVTYDRRGYGTDAGFSRPSSN